MLFLSALLLSARATPVLEINPSNLGHAISPDLYGIFFEEINHAGQGGLYAELVRNSGFESAQRNIDAKLAAFHPWTAVSHQSDISGVSVSVETDLSMNTDNAHYLRINTTTASSGASNPGFWGANFEKGKEYEISFFARAADANTKLTVQFVSQSAGFLGKASFRGISSTWEKYSTTIRATGSDSAASIEVLLDNAGQVDLDVVSVMPARGWRGVKGIREDLGDKLALIQPKFVRFPGGCFVEGDNLADAFIWTKSIGPKETRPGHWDLWGYYSEDFLGLYEYLLTIEALKSKPIWVINNGVAHADSIAPADIQPWIDSALNSIEFMMGGVNTTWGGYRASLGHPKPFQLPYMAIGNEDCGKPYYLENYIAFYKAIKEAYPAIQLIANCDLSGQAPVDLWDYHIYTSVSSLINKRNTFDNAARGGAKIFVSEYAVTVDCGLGNLKAAVAEAAWMTGMERNSDLVTLASYAPLFVNTNDRFWNPDAIVFNSSFSYGTPSFWVQTMFGRNTGEWTLKYNLTEDDSIAVAASADRHGSLYIKVVNFVDSPVDVQMVIPGIWGTRGKLITLTSDSGDDENSFEDPEKVVPEKSLIEVGEQFVLSTKPQSVNILKVRTAVM